MDKDQAKHQAELAASGYRLPDSMYVAPAVTNQPSAEKDSGDGGANVDADPADSAHGYKGKLTSAVDASVSALEKSAANERAQRASKDTPASVGLRVAREGHVAVGAAQTPGVSSRDLVPTDPTASSSSGSDDAGADAGKKGAKKP